MTFSQEDLNVLIGDVTVAVPHLVPFLFVFPVRVIDKTEWNTLVNSRRDSRIEPTACCTENQLLFVDTFIGNLPDNKKRGLIVHEVLHPALGHLSDPFVDFSIDYDSFRSLSNTAKDLVVEGLIDDLSEGYQPGIPREDRKILANYEPDVYMPYKGMDWVSVYRIIRDKELDLKSLDHMPRGSLENDIKGILETCRKESNIILEKLRSLGTAKNVLDISETEPTVNWYDILKIHILEKPKPRSLSWKKPNRRYYAVTGEYKPSLAGIETTVGKITVFVDVSYSAHDLLNNVLADLKNLLVQLQPKEIDIVYYDTKIIDTQTINTEEDFEFKKIPSGTGTSIIDSLIEFSQGKENIEGPCLILTDGEDEFMFPDYIQDYLGDNLYILSYRTSLQTNHGIYIPVKF